MTDLNKLSPSALKAALAGGTVGWGEVGGIEYHVPYSEPISVDYPMRRRRLCCCGCRKKVTFVGKCNGVALMSGCQLTVARWAKDPVSFYQQRRKNRS